MNICDENYKIKNNGSVGLCIHDRQLMEEKNDSRLRFLTLRTDIYQSPSKSTYLKENEKCNGHIKTDGNIVISLPSHLTVHP